MMLKIPAVLDAKSVAAIRGVIEAADWTDGNITSGQQSAHSKHNMQLPEKSPAARQAGDAILTLLERNPRFISASLPLRIYPPLFNRYDAGMEFGTHIDNAIRFIPGHPIRVRTDLSATLFLTPPQDYDGGELVVEDTFGDQVVKLGAGDMVLYPSCSRHHVRPISRGSRLACFFWVQSMIRDDGQRSLLFDFDTAIQSLRGKEGETAPVVQLTGVYHNLLRRWAEA